MLRIFLVFCFAVQARALLPMSGQWAAVLGALEAGRGAQASALLREFEVWYGAEPAVQEAGFQQALLRVKALNALQCGDAAAAAAQLDAYFARFDDVEVLRAFLLYLRGLCHANTGDLAAAITAWQAFLDGYPSLPEWHLVSFHTARAAFAAGQPALAVQSLQASLDSQQPAPTQHRNLCRALLACHALQSGDSARAFALFSVLELPDPVGIGPWLRNYMAAPLLAAMAADPTRDPTALRRTSTWVRSATALQADFAALERRFAPPNSGQSLLDRLSHWRLPTQSQLAAQRPDPATLPSDDALLLLMLNAHRAAANWPQVRSLSRCALNFEHVVSAALRGAAYAARVEALIAAGDLDAATALANAFICAFPDAAEIPDLTFLLAKVLMEALRWPDAAAQLAQLCAAFPEHPRWPLWQLNRARANRECARYEAAIAQLDALAARAPASWQPYVTFQRGLTFFEAAAFDKAQAAFAAVARLPVTPPNLIEEAAFAALRCAVRIGDATSVDKWIAHYSALPTPRARQHAFHNLCGDWFWRCKLADKALKHFADALSAEDFAIANYAAERIALILHAEELPKRLSAHLQAWLKLCEQHLEPPPVAWVRHSLQVADSNAAAAQAMAARFLRVIDQHRNTVDFPAFAPILQWLYAATEQPARRALPWLPTTLDECRWQSLPTALTRSPESAPTVSRLLEIAAQQLDAASRPHSATLRRMQIIAELPIPLTDPNALLQSAIVARAQHLPDSDARIDFLLQHFPQHPAFAEALHLKALSAADGGEPDAAVALWYRLLNDWPDAACALAARLELAAVLLAQNAAAKALQAVEPILQVRGTKPAVVARALVLRARALWDCGDAERALLACERVLTLYPNCQTAFLSAEHLALQIADASDDHAVRTRIIALRTATAGAHLHHNPSTSP